MSRDEMLGALGRGDEVAAREMLAGAVLALLEKFDALDGMGRRPAGR
jgi:hypothetical protein